MRVVQRAMMGLVVFFAVALAGFYAVRERLPVRFPSIFLPDRPIAEIRADQTPVLRAALTELGLNFGAAVYLRVFKDEEVLELWVEKDETYQLFRTYKICYFSGALGPKLKEGDKQAPEGFYRVGAGALNPNSSYHLSFDLGYPNRFDRAHERTGSLLMIHGACASAGCYAMTDPAIEEIYVLVEAALQGGQEFVPVHAFPFRLTQRKLAAYEGHKWHGFWEELAPAYRRFEAEKKVPPVTVNGRHYQIAGG